MVAPQRVQTSDVSLKVRYGGIDCATILQDDARNRLKRCPEIVTAVSERIAEILRANDYDLEQGSQG